MDAYGNRYHQYIANVVEGGWKGHCSQFCSCSEPPVSANLNTDQHKRSSSPQRSLDHYSGIYTAEDFAEWSWMSKKGSQLSPFTPDWEAKLGLEILNMVQSRTDDIILGKFRVPIIESDPSER